MIAQPAYSWDFEGQQARQQACALRQKRLQSGSLVQGLVRPFAPLAACRRRPTPPSRRSCPQDHLLELRFQLGRQHRIGWTKIALRAVDARTDSGIEVEEKPIIRVWWPKNRAFGISWRPRNRHMLLLVL
jgi:hypothetical protein